MEKETVVQIATEIDGTMKDVRNYLHMAEMLLRQPITLRDKETKTDVEFDNYSDADLTKSSRSLPLL